MNAGNIMHAYYLPLHVSARVLHAGTQRSRPGSPADQLQRREAAAHGEHQEAPELSDGDKQGHLVVG